MLAEPNCRKRECKHYGGMKLDDNEEITGGGFFYCKAFPEGIPREIVHGDNKHLSKHPDQKNDIVFEK